MLHNDEEFRDLLKRVRAGDPAATQTLVDQYRTPILVLVRRKLPERMRNQYDSQDFLQDVWASFCAMTPDAWNFKTAAQLCAYLGEMATHKVIDRFRQRYAVQRREGDRVRSLDGSAALPAAAHAGPDPTPSRVVMAREQLAQLLADKPEDVQRLLLLVGSGNTAEEIARELDLPARNVRRLLENVRNGERRRERA
jgi:DNA-directed RNA polymerase specialized sigma24 family protein